MAGRTNDQWLSDLRSSGPVQEAALEDLRATILAGLPYALSQWLRADDPKFPALAEEVAQEAVLRILDRLDTFEGRSQFTTWAYKVAVRIALTELRRRKWRDVSLESLVEGEQESGTAAPQLMADSAPGPEAIVERGDMLAHVRRLIDEELTAKQRQAMLALVVQGMPLEEVARRMGMERNALYKLMHDARLRLKRRMALEGMTSADVLSVFDRG